MFLLPRLLLYSAGTQISLLIKSQAEVSSDAESSGLASMIPVHGY